MNHTYLPLIPAAEHRRTLAGTHFIVPRRVEGRMAIGEGDIPFRRRHRVDTELFCAYLRPRTTAMDGRTDGWMAQCRSDVDGQAMRARRPDWPI